MSEPHRRRELEAVALEKFDREREQAVRGQRGRNRNKQRPKVADIDERIGGDDEIEDPRRLAREQVRPVADDKPVIDAAFRALAIIAGERSTPIRWSTRLRNASPMGPVPQPMTGPARSGGPARPRPRRQREGGDAIAAIFGRCARSAARAVESEDKACGKRAAGPPLAQ